MGIVIMKVNHHINYRDFRVGANLADQSKPFVVFCITCWLQTWNLRFHNWCISFIFFYIQKNRTKVFAPITLLSTLILTIIISGDSKGSILETTFSNLSISHLFYIITVASLYNFADASTLLASAITIPELISVLKREYSWLVWHCVKSVQIRSYSGPHFPAFGMNNSEYGHFLRSVLLTKW